MRRRDVVEDVIEVVGRSTESWEAAGRAALAELAGVTRCVRSAELVKQDLVVEDGLVVAYRVRLAVALEPAVPPADAARFPDPAVDTAW